MGIVDNMSETISSTMDNLSAPEIPTSDEEQIKIKTTADPDSLTADLIELIAAKATSVEDFVRFGAVRRSWRLATLTVKPKLDYLSLCPLLMVGPKTGDEPSGSLYSFATGERFQIETPGNLDGLLWPWWGSPFGWVCVESGLINPLSGACLDLSFRPPPIPGIRRGLQRLPTFVRTVLTASLDDPDCIFFSIRFEGRRVLYYLRPGDLDLGFSDVDHTEGWSDIIRFKGNVYGCLCDGKVLLISASSAGSLELTAAEFAAAPPELGISSSVEEVPAVLDVKYLVDLGGELGMVVRCARQTNIDLAINVVTISTFRFEIYKLDIYTKNWDRVLSLGDKCIFVGASYSYSIRASSSRLEPNCIYFTDDFSSFKDTIDKSAFKNPYNLFKNLGIEDMGIYNVENGQVTAFTTILSVSDEELYSPYFKPIWFTPALQ